MAEQQKSGRQMIQEIIEESGGDKYQAVHRMLECAREDEHLAETLMLAGARQWFEFVERNEA